VTSAPDHSGDSTETTAHKEIVMFSSIPIETLLRSHMDGARLYHRLLRQIAEVRRNPGSDRRPR
jgi:hypothetical protein